MRQILNGTYGSDFFSLQYTDSFFLNLSNNDPSSLDVVGIKGAFASDVLFGAGPRVLGMTDSAYTWAFDAGQYGVGIYRVDGGFGNGIIATGPTSIEAVNTSDFYANVVGPANITIVGGQNFWLNAMGGPANVAMYDVNGDVNILTGWDDDTVAVNFGWSEKGSMGFVSPKDVITIRTGAGKDTVEVNDYTAGTRTVNWEDYNPFEGDRIFMNAAKIGVSGADLFGVNWGEDGMPSVAVVEGPGAYLPDGIYNPWEVNYPETYSPEGGDGNSW